MSANTINFLSRMLDASALRHKVHSNNVANINTPLYKRQLVAFEEQLHQALNTPGAMSLRTTNTRHIHDIRGFHGVEPIVVIDNNSAMRLDGNNVDIDMELALLAENTVKFNVLSQSISKKMGLLQSAIKGGR